MESLNNRLILEVYVPKALETKVSNGFASINQATNLAGLRLLADFRLPDGRIAAAGSVAYIKEHSLMTNPLFKQAFSLASISQKFIIAPFELVEMMEIV